MSKAIYLAVGLVAGAAVSAWYARTAETPSTQEVPSDARTESIEARLLALENSVASELNSVRGEVESLRNELTSQTAASPGSTREPSRAVARESITAGAARTGGIE